MKFLLVASYVESILSFRGALINELGTKGCEVHVAAPELSRDIRTCDALRSMGAQVHDIPLGRNGTNPFSDIVLLYRLFWLIRRVRPSVVLAYTIKPVIYGTLAAWIARVPRRFALITGLGYAFTEGRANLLVHLIRRLYSFALRKTHKVFFQNADDQALFRTSKIILDKNPSVVVNGSGVDVSGFAVQPLPNVGAKFLLIARLLGDKGVREYVAAAQNIRAQYAGASFGLVGWIDSNPDSVAQSELDEWIRKGHIEFYGKLGDVRPAIANCNVYVLPSYREGVPRTVLEAMAMGRPIITTDAPGCRETVIDGDNGFLVPVKSVSRLEEAMIRFIDDPLLASRMGERSRKMAEEKYNVKMVNGVMLSEMGIRKNVRGNYGID